MKARTTALGLIILLLIVFNDSMAQKTSFTTNRVLPIGGGGEATVNGNPYSIKSGQYYLFTGRINVSVSTKNPGSMGHWSICIDADRAPVSGNGNKRPKSPCKAEKNNGNKGKGNKR